MIKKELFKTKISLILAVCSLDEMSIGPLMSFSGRISRHLGRPHFPQSSWIIAHSYSSASTKDDFNFLQRSIMPTDHFQKSLPRLPVPKLEDSCRRYLKALEPVLTADDWQKTSKIVAKFQEGEGKELQKFLKAKDKKNKHTSYVTGPWFDMYLKDRQSVVLNYNPFMMFSDDPKKPYNDQLIRATNMIVSSMRMLKTLRAKILEPEIYHLFPEKSDNQRFRKFVSYLPESISWYGALLHKAFPLDMSQYGNLFNSTRIPRIGKDEIWSNSSARHILVIRNGNYYAFDVLDRDGNVRSPVEILSCLKYIIDDKSPKSDYPVGVLTSENRDVWAKIRQTLLTSGNEQTLNLIDSATFVLSLEDVETEDPNTLSRLFLYGDPANRWFDKSFTLIMTPSGITAVNFEHSWGDGVAVLRYFNEVFKDSTEKPQVHPDTRPSGGLQPDVRKLDWLLSDEVKEAIRVADDKYKRDTSRLDINYMQYTKYGRNGVRKHKISPDAYMQLGFQMAFFKQYGRTVPTYESCSTAAYKHGRTETIRSATTATKNSCELFASSKSSVAEMRKSLEECSAVHSQLVKEAAMGQGFDRHLFALRQIASEQGQLPELYTDPAYSFINHNILSTSTLVSPSVRFGGFAPVVPDGYGIGYAAQDNFLGCNVTCYPPSRNIPEFLDCVRQSFDEMFEVLEGRPPRK